MQMIVGAFGIRSGELPQLGAATITSGSCPETKFIIANNDTFHGRVGDLDAPLTPAGNRRRGLRWSRTWGPACDDVAMLAKETAARATMIVLRMMYVPLFVGGSL